MIIALISAHYPPMLSSCAIQMRDLAQELLQQGHEPIVIVPSEALKCTSVFEKINNVLVLRISAFKTIDIGFIRRAVNEALLPFMMLNGLRKSDLHIDSIDAVVWYSPTIFFGPFVQFIKKSSKCPSYLILRDIFPEWALDLGILRKGLFYHFFKLVAKYQYSVADIIGVQTASNLKYFENWSKKPNRKLEVLNNWLSPTSIQDLSISIAGSKLEGRKIFVYVGNMGIAQGMDILIELAESLKTRMDIGFLFVGRGTEVENLKQSVSDKQLDNTLFYDEIDSKEMPSLLALCHVGLVALDPRHKSHNIPGKFLTYIQAGLPVLGRINAETDLAKLIENENVGRVYVGGDISSFKIIAEEMIDSDNNLQKMSKRGHDLSHRMFSSTRAVKQIITSLSSFL
jgi:glycosyltransferase involved in cell wall biosynthesis